MSLSDTITSRQAGDACRRILRSFNHPATVTARSVSFSDLARGGSICVTVRAAEMIPLNIQDQLEAAAQSDGFILQYSWPGLVQC